MMIVIAHHDNSANKVSNPDANHDVRRGELTSEEMMLPWFGVVVKRDAERDAIAFYRPGGFDSPDVPAPRITPKLPLPTPPFAGNKAPVPGILRPAILRQTR